ncbi:hypothetical protein [Cohnella mopanensis]|uniref:hypothetical protein n=1 Tax=Cohnella mopanensis TaxID=2911966 RepID=UPI001EF86C78|nr:hypothetical protein [Cohnella mopanensis]
MNTRTLCETRQQLKEVSEYVMNIREPISLLIFILITVLSITACNANTSITSQELDKIDLKVINRSELPEGIAYTIKLTNNSKHSIKQNIVFISYTIKTQNGSKGNEFKVEAKGNKLNIKPHEEVILNAFTPIEEYQGNNKLNLKEGYLDIQGYIDEVEEANHFGKTIGIHFES